MKNQLFVLIGLGLLLATASAYAQTGVVKANVPFNFIVDKTEVPAGQYVIQPIGSTGTALALENAKHEVVKLILPNSCQSFRRASENQTDFPPLRYPVFPVADMEQGKHQGSRASPRAHSKTNLRWTIPTQNVVVVATLR